MKESKHQNHNPAKAPTIGGISIRFAVSNDVKAMMVTQIEGSASRFLDADIGPRNAPTVGSSSSSTRSSSNTRTR